MSAKLDTPAVLPSAHELARVVDQLAAQYTMRRLQFSGRIDF